MNRKSLIIFRCEDWKCPPAASTDTVQLSTPGPSPCCPGVCIHSEWDVLVLARTSNRRRTKQAHQLHTVPWTLPNCKSSLLCFKPVSRHQSSDAPVFATALYWRCFKPVSLSDQSTLCCYSLCSWKAASAAGAAVCHKKERSVLWLGFNCSRAGGLAVLFCGGWKAWKGSSSWKRWFFFFNLENSSWNDKAAPIPLCCRNCCVKIKSGLIVVELHLGRLSIRSELKAGKEHRAARQIFQAFPPSTPPHLRPACFSLY